MPLLDKIKSLFRPSAQPSASEPEGVFVYVKIPEDIQPLDRGDKYEDPLDELLQAEGVGEVSGGGSQLGENHPDGTPSVEFCGIDIDGPELQPILVLLRRHLPELGIPEGTELHYTVEGERLQDVFGGGSWSKGLPRTFLHPGFNC